MRPVRVTTRTSRRFAPAFFVGIPRQGSGRSGSRRSRVTPLDESRVGAAGGTRTHGPTLCLWDSAGLRGMWTYRAGHFAHLTAQVRAAHPATNFAGTDPRAKYGVRLPWFARRAPERACRGSGMSSGGTKSPLMVGKVSGTVSKVSGTVSTYPALYACTQEGRGGLARCGAWCPVPRNASRTDSATEAISPRSSSSMGEGSDTWRPHWWRWPILVSGHLLERMVDRRFTEADLREMLEDVSRVRPGSGTSRWVAECPWRGEYWEVVLEPDPASNEIVVVTAYRVL